MSKSGGEWSLENFRTLDLSSDYSSFRSSRHSETHQGAEYTKHGLKLISKSLRQDHQATPIEVIVDLLHQTTLPGPLVLIKKGEILGRGSQFVVYKERVATPNLTSGFSLRDVAFKLPRFPLDPTTPFRLASADARRHLYHIYLEVLVLGSPELRKHPNIARLLGWSNDSDSQHNTVGLVMELAHSTLIAFIRECDSPSMKFKLCIDVAAGLDALHGCGVIHGDLKPENVLVYQRKNGHFVAKLADFGLSVYDEEVMLDFGSFGGTRGWQAPEVERGEDIDKGSLLLTDCYSFGLLIWSVMLHDGKVPPTSPNQSRRCIALNDLDNNPPVQTVGKFSCVLRDVLKDLLEVDPSRRSYPLWPLLCDHLITHEPLGVPKDLSLSADNSSDHSDDVADFADYPFNEAEDHGSEFYPWEAATVPDCMVDEIYSRVIENPELINPETLFGTFLVLTNSPGLAYTSRNAVLDTLLIAAVRGSESARGVVPIVISYFSATVEEEVQSHFPDWLRRSVAAGSIIARHELQRVDPEIFPKCLEYFREMGGYAGHYWALSSHGEEPLQDQLPPPGRYPLHWLAAFGTIAQLSKYVETNSCDINGINEHDETPVYLACARGLWPMVAALLDRGADPKIRCRGSHEISCLHWAFSFDDAEKAPAISRLLAEGAELDAMSKDVTPFLHYPFVLPIGSPLHWAVAIGSHDTIAALVRAGADLLLRNEADDYVRDERVRILDKWGGPNRQAYSVPDHEVHGATALDCAAMKHDPFIFEHLVDNGIPIDINAVDEEGFSVLHRLSMGPQRETRAGNIYSDLVFRGRPSEMEGELRRVIAAIKRLGGNLELLSSSPRPEEESGTDDPMFPPRTPLMMAALGTSPTLVKTLLELGAEVNTQNELGMTAVMFVSQDREVASENLRILVSYGADIHHSSKFGRTPILEAALAGLTDSVDLLLSRGVDIASIYMGPDETLRSDANNIFRLLARETPPFSEERDIAVAALLEKYVFSCSDRLQKSRLIENGDIDGTTLLHRFSECSMRHCVIALLANGAPVNASKYCFMRNHVDGELCKTFWYETPLDMASKEREIMLDDLKGDSQYTIEQGRAKLQRIEAIISMLKEAGGVRKSHVLEHKPFVFDESRYGTGEYIKALREF